MNRHFIMNLVQANPNRILVTLTLGLLVLCIAIKSAKFDAELSSWIQRTSRVDSELNYVSASIGEGQGGSSQLLLQTPRHHRANTLTVEALMIHLEALAIATHVTVDLYDVTWSLKDICFTPTLPDFDLHIINMLDRMMPCVIKTPLDCFWEGSKLLGPDQPISFGSASPKWTTLNPLAMVETMKRSQPHASFPYSTLIDWMIRVGITDGYQHKPCLDPTDPNCPFTSPNKNTREPPDIGLHLTGGCRGFAANQMHWKEEEIVGGSTKNKSGYIVKASGLQSTIQLMREQDMYDYWRKSSKTQDIHNWSADKAKVVLDSWQKNFKQELDQFAGRSGLYKIHAMTSKSMLEPIDFHSLIDPTNFGLCFTLMTIFTCIAFPTFKSTPSKENFSKGISIQEIHISRSKTVPLAIIASVLIGLTFIASLGLSSFWGLPFNMATTQILPPLALYYGFNQFIMIANVYSEKFGIVQRDNLASDCLAELSPIIAIEVLSYTIALLVSTIIPVEATRVFAWQAVTYILLATLTSFLLMPSLMTTFLSKQIGAKQYQIDEEDQLDSRIDLDLKSLRGQHCSDIQIRTSFRLTTRHNVPNSALQPTMKEDLKSIESMTTGYDKSEQESCLFSVYAYSLTANKPFQLSLCLVAFLALFATLSRAPEIKYGLHLKDIVAQGTAEYESFLIQEKNFPIYNVFAITKGNFDYPNNQRLLHEFYKTLEQVNGIVRDEEMGKTKFWLVAFRDWLLEIQQKFDIDRKKSAISAEGWNSDASDAAKLAYKLLAQTGRVDNPIDKSQVESNRLVDSNGIINPKAFYYYLTAWVINDPFTYTTSEANFRPEPKIWNDKPDDLKIEKARPLTYSQIPFLIKLPSSQDILETISEIRSISQSFEQLNLPNFPTGIPFIFWDQFINLDLLLFMAMAIGVTLIFIVIGITQSDFNLSAIITIPITLTVLGLYSMVGYLSIPFNNILAVLLVSNIGIATVQTTHIATYSRNKEGSLAIRTREALRLRFRVVVTRLLLFFFCVLIFYHSKIEFMIKYSSLLIFLAIFNSIVALLLAPIMISMFGSDYKPITCREKEVEKKVACKTAKTRKRRSRQVCQKKIGKLRLGHRNYQMTQSGLSLSTISEEPQSEAVTSSDLKIDIQVIRCH